MNAPMGGAAGGALAAAVSRAGGLGMIGVGSAGSAHRLAAELEQVTGLGRPSVSGWSMCRCTLSRNCFRTAIAAHPVMLAVSFADTWDWVHHVHDAGIVAATQVAELDGALRAVDAGVDVIVARGAEGGGHGRPLVGTLPLLTEILDQVSVPVLAAGGISSGRGLAAVLAAGAAGAWVGTAFAACTESLASDQTRRALVAAREIDTVLTREFDIAAGYRWPAISGTGPAQRVDVDQCRTGCCGGDGDPLRRRDAHSNLHRRSRNSSAAGFSRLRDGRRRSPGRCAAR